MKKHDWKIETIDQPGPKFYWICRKCGCSGGPSFLPWEQLEVKEPKWRPFLAGVPLIDLPDDCDLAKKMIDEFIEKYPEWKPKAARARGGLSEKEIRTQMSNLKHGPGQKGDAGPCDQDCRKCFLDLELQKLGAG